MTQTFEPQTYRVTRADLVRYAGASGDFNPIHWNERVATAVGLPGVIAHGMFTMALAGRAVTDWTGDAGALVEYQVRFGRPVLVPDDDAGAEVTVRGTVAALLEDPEVGIDYSRVVHGEQRFAHHRPIRAGDRLVATTTIDAARTVAGNDLLTARVDLTTEDGEAVCTATSILVARA